jgi:hypothetical protein
MLSPAEIRSIYADHNTYWENKRPEMRRLSNLYSMRYWKRADDLNDKVNITVESSRGFEVIEGYVASLFTRDPAVTVAPDLRGRGDPQVTQAVSNDFLRRARGSIEHATRIGLVFDCAFIKMHPTPGPDPLQRVDVEAVSPWDIIVDAAAPSWNQQRWVAHRYLLPLEEAKSRYGNKKYTPRAFHRFLDAISDDVDSSSLSRNYARGGPQDSVSRSQSGFGTFAASATAVEQFIEVVEFYDLTPGQDALVVWSPDYANGDKLLYKGVRIQVGSSLENTPDATTGAGQTEEEIESQYETYSGIPYRTASGRPMTPIIPLIFTSDINAPLRGYSTMRRVADYVQEINIVRSYQANAVRKTARQWLIEKGLLDADAAAKIAMGVDGEMIEVELSNGQTLAGSMIPVPHTPTPPELQSYIMEIEGDLSRGSILAPFTRGEATKATATEVTALASYSSSEIGRLARTRDEAIAELARVYSVMLSLILGDAIEPLLINSKTVLLSADDLTADFRFFATDVGATPLADAAKRRNLVELVGVLTQLGVDPQAIRAEIVRLYDLPTSFLGAEQEAPTAAETVPGATGTMPPGAAPAPMATAPQNVTEALSSGPSPGGIGPLLPGGV